MNEDTLTDNLTPPDEYSKCYLNCSKKSQMSKESRSPRHREILTVCTLWPCPSDTDQIVSDTWRHMRKTPVPQFLKPPGSFTAASAIPKSLLVWELQFSVGFLRLFWPNAEGGASIPWSCVSRGEEWFAVLCGGEEWWHFERPRGLLRYPVRGIMQGTIRGLLCWYKEKWNQALSHDCSSGHDWELFSVLLHRRQ